jgi:hypothetical protein
MVELLVVLATEADAVEIDLALDVGVKFTPVYTICKSTSEAWP